MLFALLGGQVDQKSGQGPPVQIEPEVTEGAATLASPAIPNAGELRYVESFPSAEWHVDPAPTTSSFNNHNNPNPGGGAISNLFMDTERGVEDMDATELWARLQSFYEPSPNVWGAHPGFVDYVTALGSMGMS